MKKIIVIDCDPRLERHDHRALVPLQGSLKSLSNAAYEKLSKSIVERGFFAPVFIWQEDVKLWIIDGHQRVMVLNTLMQNGYDVPPIPVVRIHAESLLEAKEKLLLVSSQFGKIERDGLYEFLQDLEADIVVKELELPNIEPLKFMDEFFNDTAEQIEALPPVSGNLGSVGGNGVKMLQLYFSEEDHQKIIQQLGFLQEAYKTENATDTIKEALENAVEAASNQ